MWILLLIACRSEEQQPVPETLESTEAEARVTLEPSALDFGAVGVGTYQEAHIFVHNEGQENLLVGGLGSTTAELEVTSLNTLMVPPGGQTELMVTWLPEEVGALFAHLYVEVGTSPSDLEDLVVEVAGSADGSQLSVSAEALDFGSVPVGCAAERELSLVNEGEIDVIIEDIDLQDRTWMALEAIDDDLYAMPWTLAPGEGRTLSLTFTPEAYRSIETSLRLVTNDALQPEQELPVSAEGLVDGSQTLEWSLTPDNWQYTTALFHVNEVAIRGSAAAYFQASLPTYFETLQASQVPYRVAFILENDGVVYGDVDYIDQTLTPTQATSAALAMLGETSAYNDHDQNFIALDNGLSQNADWLIDESAQWRAARLNMVAINDDIEQSGGHWSQYVGDWQSYKDEPSDMVVHAIGGDVPRGCGVADPFTAFYDAAQATGGTFGSICATDWGALMRDLAEASVGQAPRFYLEGDPLLDTLEVYVDDTLQRSGWSYRESTNEVVFEDAYAPRFNTDVRVTYLTAGACE